MVPVTTSPLSGSTLPSSTLLSAIKVIKCKKVVLAIAIVPQMLGLGVNAKWVEELKITV